MLDIAVVGPAGPEVRPQPVRGIFRSHGKAADGRERWHLTDALDHVIAEVSIRPGTEDRSRALLAEFLELQDPTA